MFKFLGFFMLAFVGAASLVPLSKGSVNSTAFALKSRVEYVVEKIRTSIGDFDSREGSKTLQNKALLDEILELRARIRELEIRKTSDSSKKAPADDAKVVSSPKEKAASPDSEKIVLSLRKELDKVKSKSEDLSDELAVSKKKLYAVSKANNTLEEKLKKEMDLRFELKELKRKLALSKAETLLKEREIGLLNKQRGESHPSKNTGLAVASHSGNRGTGAGNNAPGVLVVEVTKDKVNLRSGPGKKHSPVMQLREGSRLTVEAKEGDWYRVLTPTGSRAYVSSDVVRLYNEDALIDGVFDAPAPKKIPLRPSRNSSLVPFGDVGKMRPRYASPIERMALDYIRSGIGKSEQK